MRYLYFRQVGSHLVTFAPDCAAARPLVSSLRGSHMVGEARAIYDYEARASDELSFKRHDIIQVLGEPARSRGGR